MAAGNNNINDYSYDNNNNTTKLQQKCYQFYQYAFIRLTDYWLVYLWLVTIMNDKV